MYHAHTTNESTSASQLQAFAARSLGFLNLIESTVRRLVADAEMLNVFTRDIRQFVDELSANDFNVAIDPDGRVCEMLRRSSDGAARVHSESKRRHAAALSDPNLLEDDGVAPAWSAFLDAIAGFHDAVEDLRDVVETLDARLEPDVAAGPFRSADELMSHLLAS